MNEFISLAQAMGEQLEPTNRPFGREGESSEMICPNLRRNCELVSRKQMNRLRPSSRDREDRESGNGDAMNLRHELQVESISKGAELMSKEAKLTVLLDDQSVDTENTEVSSEHETILTSTDDEYLRILLLELCLLLPSIEPVVGGSVKTVFSTERTTSVSQFFVTFDLPESSLFCAHKVQLRCRKGEAERENSRRK